MPHEGIDHASRRNGKCITREEYFHHDGKNQPREAEKGAFKSGKTMSCGAENYGLVFFNVTFSIYFSCMFYGIPFFFIPLLPKY